MWPRRKDKPLGPLKIHRLTGEGMSWSQRINRIGRQKSLNWDDRSRRPFKKEDVYPCNEGFPRVTQIGPVSGGMPILFNLILANGLRCRGTVSTTHMIDEQPAWAVHTRQGIKHISYYNVAAWSSL